MSKKADVSSAALTNLYIELNKAGKSEEFDKAIKVANKILNLDKGATKAFHYKIICLINGGKFQDALKQLGASSKMASGLHFEKAYCEYRLNRNEVALQTLDACGDDSLRAKELRAQIFYRLERFREAHKEFRDVIKNTDDDFNDEREANLAAVLAQLQQTDSSAPELSGSEQQLTAAGGATYEQLYNVACSQLAGGEYQLAADTLTTAADLCCRTMQQDDAEPDEIQQEMAVINVQRGYCLQRLGQASEASAVYHDTLRRRPTDPAVLIAASNNVVAINGDQNVFDSRKRIKALSGEGLDKLTSGQRKQLAVNQCLFSLFTHQGEQLQRHLTALAEQYPEEVVTCALIRAAHQARRNHDEAARQLQQLIPTAAAADRLRLQLAHVQLLINKGELMSACDELGKLTDVSGLPGVVSTRVALCKRAGDNTAASQILQEAVQHNRQSANGGDLTVMWRRAAEFHLKCGDARAAASLLEQLLKRAPKDKRTVAQLVVAYSQFDQQKARAVSSGLPPPQTASSVDVAALETAGWSSSGRLRRAVTAAGQHSPGSPSPGVEGGDAAGSSALVQKKKKLGSSKRRRRLPAGCTGGAPDPERWLPRRERSSYKPRKRRRNDPLKGTQGGPSAQSDLYDITKTAPQQKASPVPDQSGSAPRQRNAQKKRKQTKRAGRW